MRPTKDTLIRQPSLNQWIYSYIHTHAYIYIYIYIYKSSCKLLY